MTSNEEIYRLMAKYPKICNQKGWTWCKTHDENPKDYEDEDSYDDYEPDYERQAEIDEAMLWDI